MIIFQSSANHSFKNYALVYLEQVSCRWRYFLDNANENKVCKFSTKSNKRDEKVKI